MRLCKFYNLTLEFFAALRMTVFYIIRVRRAIRDEPLRGLIFFRWDNSFCPCYLTPLVPCSLSIFFWCAKENARKRKAHEPFPLDTRPPPRKHAPGGSFLLARHMRPQTRFCSDSAGLCGRLRRPSPRRSQKAPPFALQLVEVGSSNTAGQMCENDVMLRNEETKNL